MLLLFRKVWRSRLSAELSASFSTSAFVEKRSQKISPVSSIVAVLAFSLSHIWKVLTGLYLPDSRVVLPTPLLSFTAVLLVLEMCHNKMMGKKHHLSIKIFFFKAPFLLLLLFPPPFGHRVTQRHLNKDLETLLN